MPHPVRIPEYSYNSDDSNPCLMANQLFTNCSRQQNLKVFEVSRKKTTKPSLFAKLESQVQAHRPIPDGPHPELPGGWSPKASRSAPATR